MKGRKTGGRKAGTPNKTTVQVRGMIQAFIEKNWSRIQRDYNSLSPKERLTFLSSLLKHVLPEPLSLEKLTEEQLEQLHDYLLKQMEL